MKKAVAILLCLTMAAGLMTGCAQKTTKADNGNVITFGVNYELTGDNPVVGQSSGNGVDLAVEEINANGGITINGKKYTMAAKKLDNEFNAESAAVVAQTFADDDSICAMIGPNDSAMCLGCQSIVEKEGLPSITPWATQVDITKGDYFFRACYTDDFQGQILAQYAYKENGCKTAAILYDMSNDYCVGIAKIFKASFEKLGGTVVEYQSYNSNETDFTSQLTKILAADPEILLLPNFYSDVATQASQAVALGYKGQFIGSDTWGDNLLLQLDTEGNLNGSVWCGHYAKDMASAQALAFIDAFQKKYGSDEIPNDISALNYDSVYLLKTAIEKAQSTERNAIRDALANIGTYEGVTGTMNFNGSHDPTKSAVMIKIVDGAFTYLETLAPK